MRTFSLYRACTRSLVLSVPKFTANQAGAVQICGKFWDTQYIVI